ncbi:hypothetical protein JWJ90_12060 [Desulfobulbus rhabdoformis]|uniref:hypothetical protein n=1 Tax=Desulfobulbus rhabdoformis TaxID=34032 RepID=UPI0019622EC5|nr:hypothetical protein [Desulfobulbus rhabdoformis]MBM9615014.1 hypothetical protein [Desulfobulbus rhabdoformis]
MFGEILRSARKKAGFKSMELFTEEVNKHLQESITWQAVQKWETNINRPESDKWGALDSALGAESGWTMRLVLKQKAIDRANETTGIEIANCFNANLELLPKKKLESPSNGRSRSIQMDKSHAEIVECMLDLFSFGDWADLASRLDQMEERDG